MILLILGYGKMGRSIEKLALEKGYEVLTADNAEERNGYLGKHIDVAIEFSQPDAAFGNIEFCLRNNIPVVSGTTGWLDQKPEIDKICIETEGTFFYASNYSLGVNLFFALNKYLSRLMEPFDQYDVSMEEIHHTEKKDSPSGTAITLAEGIIESLSRKSKWEEDSEGPDTINIHSIREGAVPGTHSVTYSSSLDEIEIKHTAKTRESFAKGALVVAEWVVGKKGVLDMNDFLPNLI